MTATIDTARMIATSSKISNASVKGAPRANDARTRTGVTNNAIWTLEIVLMPTLRSILFFHAMVIAAPCSAALPMIAITMTPMNSSGRRIPSAGVTPSTAPTRISAMRPTRTVAPTRTPIAKFRLQIGFSCSCVTGLNTSLWVWRENTRPRTYPMRSSPAIARLTLGSWPVPFVESWNSSGITRATIASTRSVTWSSAARMENDCFLCRIPPTSILRPRTRRIFPMIEPVIDAFTTSTSPFASVWYPPAAKEAARPSATRAMMSSVAFPIVALRSPPIPGPARLLSSSVASPIRFARGMTATPAAANTARSGAPKRRSKIGMGTRAMGSRNFHFPATFMSGGIPMLRLRNSFDGLENVWFARPDPSKSEPLSIYRGTNPFQPTEIRPFRWNRDVRAAGVEGCAGFAYDGSEDARGARRGRRCDLLGLGPGPSGPPVRRAPRPERRGESRGREHVPDSLEHDPQPGFDAVRLARFQRGRRPDVPHPDRVGGLHGTLRAIRLDGAHCGLGGRADSRVREGERRQPVVRRQRGELHDRLDPPVRPSDGARERGDERVAGPAPRSRVQRRGGPALLRPHPVPVRPDESCLAERDDRRGVPSDVRAMHAVHLPGLRARPRGQRPQPEPRPQPMGLHDRMHESPGRLDGPCERAGGCGARRAGRDPVQRGDEPVVGLAGAVAHRRQPLVHLAGDPDRRRRA